MLLRWAWRGVDNEDSEGKQYAYGENITHHEDNWRSWQQELLQQKKVSWGCDRTISVIVYISVQQQVLLPRNKVANPVLSLFVTVALARRSDSWSCSVLPRRIKWFCYVWASAGLTIMWGAGMRTGSQLSRWWTALHVTHEEVQISKRLCFFPSLLDKVTLLLGFIY